MAPTQRFYAGATSQTTIAGSISNSATTLTVASAVGFPATTPFAIVLDVGLSSEEKMLVTNVASTTFTVTRGFDGTTGVAHNSGATVNHVFAAQDCTDFSGHIFTTTEDDHTQYVKAGTVARGVGSLVNTTAVTVTGTTSQTNLQSVTFPANSLLQGFYAQGQASVRVTVLSSGTETIKVSFAGSNITSFFPGAVSIVILVDLIVRTGGAGGVVVCTATSIDSLSNTTVGFSNIGADLTMSQVLQFTSTATNTSTSVTQDYLTMTVYNV